MNSRQHKLDHMESILWRITPKNICQFIYTTKTCQFIWEMNPISVLKWLHKFRSWSPTAAINVKHTETICYQSPAVLSHQSPLLLVQQQQNKTCLRKLLTEFIQFLLKRRLLRLCIHHLIPDLSCKQQPILIN